MNGEKAVHARNSSIIVWGMTTKPRPIDGTITIQGNLCQPLKKVRRCKDYQLEAGLLSDIDEILRISGLEVSFIQRSMVRFRAECQEKRARGQKTLDGPDRVASFQERSGQALRCMVLKALLGVDYRTLSKLLVHSELYRRFCVLGDFEEIRVPGKSTLRDYSEWLPAEEMEAFLRQVLEAAGDREKALAMGLEQELDLSMAWMDSTCLEANVHYPVDWVLLRDAVRSLVAAILTIRRHGIVHRMPEPKGFMSKMNALAMGMAAAGRNRKSGKKERKRLVREMKQLSQVVEKHARRYRGFLDTRLEESDLSKGQAAAVARRMDNVLGQMAEVRRQVHERIIGERQVADGEKILSLYERDIHVVVRGKAGAAVEFGNTLLIVENVDGFIMDHDLKQERVPKDTTMLLERLPKLREATGGRLKGIGADRGFDSKRVSKALEEGGIGNFVCPRNPRELEKRLKEDAKFGWMLKRRGQTEGRIGILKNVFLDETPRAKGFENRRMQVAWGVLANNLRVLARLRRQAAAAKAELAQAA
jgi:hypothetical protein